MKKLIKIGERIESNTEYYADKQRYDVYLKDTLCLQSDLYTACCDVACENDESDNYMNIVFYLKDKENIVLDFCGATLYLHGMMQPFLLDNCKNITIKNCVIEYDRSLVSEAEVIESTDAYLKVKMFKNFPYRIEDGNLILTSETWECNNLDKSPVYFQFFNKETREGVGERFALIGKNPQMPASWSWGHLTLKLVAKEEEGNIVFEGEKLPIFEKGLLVAIARSPRKYSGMMIVDCENVFLENDRLLNGLGMGLLPMYTKNLYVDGFKLYYDEKSPGILSNAADGFHAIACFGDIVLKNCIFEGTVDDALNIHSQFYQVVSCEGDKLTAVSSGAVAEKYKVFDVGDKIAIYKGATLSQSSEYVIQSIRQLGGKIFEMTVDSPLSEHQKGDTIENLSAQPKVLISNCRFGKSNKLLRFQSRGGILMENCETELQFWLNGDMSYWFESSPVTNIVIKNTKFTKKRAIIVSNPEFIPSDEAPYYHGNIVVEDCEFVSTTPIKASYAKSIKFIRNKSSVGEEMSLELKNCGECETDVCKIIRKTEKKDSLRVN